LNKAGGGIDNRNSYGMTALMTAVQEGQVDVVKALLAAGADRKLRNKKPETASDIARLNGRTELLSLLE
jgi:ankyrin repeat protein